MWIHPETVSRFTHSFRVDVFISLHFSRSNFFSSPKLNRTTYIFLVCGVSFLRFCFSVFSSVFSLWLFDCEAETKTSNTGAKKNALAKYKRGDINVVGMMKTTSKRKIRSLMSQQKETPMMEINLIEVSAHEIIWKKEKLHWKMILFFVSCWYWIPRRCSLYNEIIVMKEKWHETAKDSGTEWI